MQLVGNHPGLINNVLMERVQVNAPAASGSPRAVAVPGTAIFTFAGTVGVHLKTVRRTQLDTVDVEVVETAFKEEGTGLQHQSRHQHRHRLHQLPGAELRHRLRRQQWLTTAKAHHAPDHDRDDRGLPAQDRHRLDLRRRHGQAGRWRHALPSDLWLCEPTKGAPAVQLRAYAKGVLYLAQDYRETAGAVRDGNVKNQKPRRGLILDASANDTTGVIAARVPGTTRRIEIGNGPDHPDGRLHRIELRDPLYLTPRSATCRRTPPSPAWWSISTAAPACRSTRAGGAPASTSCRAGRAASSGCPPPASLGLEPDREENGDVTLGQFHVGRMVRVNSGSTARSTSPRGSSRPRSRWRGCGSCAGAAAACCSRRPARRHQPGAPRRGRACSRRSTPVPDRRDVAALEHDAQQQCRRHEDLRHPRHHAGRRFLYSSRLRGPTRGERGQLDRGRTYAVAATHLGRIIRVANAAASFLSVGTGLCPVARRPPGSR
ncbi:MAG: hypothetical protein U1E17_15915 [Geminicoccaceae bacterium]